MKIGDLVEWDGLYTEYGKSYISKYYTGFGLIVVDSGYNNVVVVRWIRSGKSIRCVKDSLRIAAEHEFS